MCKFVDRGSKLQTVIEITPVKVGFRKIPLFPFNHNGSDTPFQQKTQESGGGICIWHRRAASFRVNSKTPPKPDWKPTGNKCYSFYRNREGRKWRI